MFSTIVIGLDESDTARQACQEGVQLAAQLGATVHLVTAYSDSSTTSDEVTAERRDAEDMIAARAAECGSDERQIVTHALRGSPVATILKVAEDVDADLIVVGNRGMRALGRLLGSVASAITTDAPCTVMVVKTT